MTIVYVYTTIFALHVAILTLVSVDVYVSEVENNVTELFSE